MPSGSGRACGGREETWITERLVAAYVGLFERGYGHSVECWAEDGAFAGGLYGVGYRPLVQYAKDYGVGVGLWARGGYWMNRHDVTAALTVWPLVVGTDGERPRPSAFVYPRPRRGYTSAFEGVDYTLRYATTPVRFAPRARAGVAFEKQQGVFENRLWGSWTFGRWAGLGRDRGTLTAEVGHLRQTRIPGAGVTALPASRSIPRPGHVRMARGAP